MGGLPWFMLSLDGPSADQARPQSRTFAERFAAGCSSLPRPDMIEACSIWNGMIARRPALVARVSGAADVVHCVNFARENRLPLSIRGGGHNVAGAALCDGGLMIDMSLRRGGAVRPRSRNRPGRGGRHLGRRRP